MTTPILEPVAAVSVGGHVLDVTEGDVSLDALRVPYAEASLSIPLDDVEILEALDPRDGLRAVLNAGDAGLVPRVFQLGVRGREVDHRAGTVELSLASDEALLQTYAPIAADLGAFAHAGSLRAVCNFILAKIGASLSAGTEDADVSPLADSENLIRNPRRVGAWDWQTATASGSLTTGTYSTGGPSFAPSYFYFGATGGAATGAYHYYSETVVSVQGARDYVQSVSVRVPSGLQVRVDAVLFDGSNNVVGYATPVLVNGSSGVWQRVAVPMWTQPTTVRIRPRVLVVGTLPNGSYIDVTGWRLSLATGDPTDTTYFDGDTTDTPSYRYDFADGPWSSPARRTPLIEAPDPAALRWGEGVTAWEFLEPLTSMAGLRLFCDENRVWRLIDPNTYTVPGRLSLAGWNTSDGTDTITLGDPETYATGVVVRYKWRDTDGIEREATDAAGEPGTVFVLDLARPYPGPGAAAAILARRAGQGRVQDVTALADWTATPGKEASVSLPGTLDQTGRVQVVAWSLADGLMQIGSRGLTEIIPGTIAALSGSIDSLVGTIDGL